MLRFDKKTANTRSQVGLRSGRTGRWSTTAGVGEMLLLFAGTVVGLVFAELAVPPLVPRSQTVIRSSSVTSAPAGSFGRI